VNAHNQSHIRCLISIKIKQLFFKFKMFTLKFKLFDLDLTDQMWLTI